MQDLPAPRHQEARQTLELVQQALLKDERLNRGCLPVFGTVTADYCDFEMRRYNPQRAPHGHALLHWGFASDCSDDQPERNGYVYACLHQGDECVAVVYPCGVRRKKVVWRLEILSHAEHSPLLRDLRLTGSELPTLTAEEAIEHIRRFGAYFGGLTEIPDAPL